MSLGEAVGYYRTLTAAGLGIFINDLARSLHNLAHALIALGRLKEGMQAAEEAVRLRRPLAETRPDAFVPDLALSLNNLATVLSALGRREEAVTAAEEAVGHYRVLAASRSDAFSGELARSLWVLGNLHGDAGKPDLAAGTLVEAIRHLSPTFLRVPQAVAGMMSGIMESYFSHCEAVGREPDVELLGPVLAVLEKFKQQEEKG